jgi:alpha-1,2-glucosyltransferase
VSAAGEGEGPIAPRFRAPMFVTWCAVGAAFAIGVGTLRGLGLLSDEVHHYSQIDLFRTGHFRLLGSITTFPTYHGVMAALAQLLGVSNLDGLRLLTLLPSLALVALAFAVTRRTSPGHPGLRTLQVLFLPILFPLHFLVYTDVSALALLCAALLALLSRRLLLAGLLASLAVAFRQGQIVWLAWVWILCVAELPREALDRRFAIRAARETWTFALGAVGFLAFVTWNGGVALGDRSMHPTGVLHPGNVYFALFLFFPMLLPLCMHRSSEVVPFLSTHFSWLLGLSAAFVYFLVAFRADHPYNQLDYSGFLHNQLIQAFTASAVRRVAFFAAVASSTLTLAQVRLQRPAFTLLYPAAVLYLLPFWMIEQRYYLAPFTLFLLLRRDEPAWLEWVLTVWLALLSFFVLFGITSGRFFP